MKFVKGDAIAGIVIIVVNLLGGLAVGVMMLGLDVGTAINKYSILTIGEGMVAQIPALLGAMAAGLIVTRTSDEDDKHLGDSIRKQIAAQPRVLIVAGVVCVLMSLVPGFPVGAFFVLALLAGGAGLMLTPSCRERLRKLRHPAVRRLVQRLDDAPAVTATALPAPRPSVPLLLRLPGPMLATESSMTLTRSLEDMLDEFQLVLGLPLPRIALHAVRESGDVSGAARWELLAYEVPIAEGLVAPGSDPQALVEPVRAALRRQAPLFLGIQDATNLLTRASADMPDVVKEVLRALPVQRVADVLRRLVGEAVSIRNLRDILEALAEAGQRDKDVQALTEFSRIALKRQISHKAAPDGKLHALLLEPALEDLLRQAVRVSAGVAQLALEPEAAQRISESLVRAVRTKRPSAIVTAVDIRWHVRRLIEAECFDTLVLSYHELMPTLQLDVVDRVAVPGAPMLEVA
jgi:type III secretion protein V